MGFSNINGREVYENEEVHIWFCPICECWRPWEELICRICRTTRDVKAVNVPNTSSGPNSVVC